ncbi:MAG: DUF2892 domain-containing protein [Anaerolineae bacterium]
MLYPKNVPNIERALRILFGVVLIGIALFGQSMIGEMSPLVIALLIFSALFVIVTGFIGWCPACALIGRKLKDQSR